jgi:hypothetical protein
MASFTYMTSTGRLSVPSGFNSCSLTLRINGRGRPGLPSAFASRTGEGKLSLGAKEAQPPPSSRLRAFLNWAISSGTAQLAQVNFQPLPPSVVTLSQAQMAKIKG